MVLITKDIPYRLLGAGHPTIACTRTSGIAANPQSRDCAATSLQFEGLAIFQPPPVIFTETEFSIGPWVAKTAIGPFDGQTAAQVLVGGNPGAYREVTTDIVGTPSVALFHSNPANVYDPAEGAIASFNFSLDFLEVFNPIVGIFTGMGFGPALEQDGCIYSFSNFVTSNQVGWTNIRDANPASGGPFTGDLDAIVATDFGNGGGGTVADFEETEFAIGPWTTEVIAGPAGGQTAVQVLAGGNPDAYRQVTTQTQLNTFTFHSDPANVYDPASGAIGFVSFEMDFLEIVGGGDGQAFGPALKQNGSFYGISNFVTRDQVGWARTALAVQVPAFAGNIAFLGSDDFPLLAGGGPSNPDFSASGAPITFGFLTANTLGINISVGYDNFSVAISVACDGSSNPDFSTSGSPITFGFLTNNTTNEVQIAGFDNFSANINREPIASGENSARLRDGDTDLGIENEWSVMLWVAPSNLVPQNTEVLFDIHAVDPSDDANAFRIEIDATGTIDFRLFSSSGILMKSYRMDSLDDLGTPGRQGFFFEENQWAQIVVTWLGSSNSMKVYRNGVLMNSDMTLVTDLVGDQTNTDRSLALGAEVSAENPWIGFMHSAALWNSELSTSDIRILWNQGAGSNVQLHTGQDDYLADRDLESWWRLGFSCIEPLIDHTSASRDLSPTGPTGPTGAP